MTIAVIGAGASGMVAALQAAWRGAQVVMFERNPSPGRKLLVTGSGRCNLTNAGVVAERYACADPVWMATLLNSFGVADLLAMLKEIGMPAQSTSDGWYYPLSNSAQTVVDAFSSALDLAGVQIHTSAQVVGMRSDANGFKLRVNRQGAESTESFSRLIVSAGGAAYPTLGSRGELFPLLAQFGHHPQPKRPALAPLLADLGALQDLQGLRFDVGATLLQGKTQLGFAAGNLIFTQWGLNGPAVMDLSHLVSARPEARLELSLNLLHFFQAEFDDLLARKRSTHLPLQVFLQAFFPAKAAVVFRQLLHLPAEIALLDVEDSRLKALVAQLKDVRLPVKGVRGFEFCQVSAGGVPVAEVSPQTLESCCTAGLYLTGETLDVTGPCGGYNLQYAFSSGALAGRAAAQ